MASYLIFLKPDEMNFLRGILDRHQDCGPRNEGWQSDELVDLKEKTEQEYKGQKDNVEPE
jgi:hypothetical protein